MKISQKLLGALVVGIAIQASTSSCNKTEIKPAKADKPGNEQPGNPNHSPDYCPACGMG